MHFKENEVVKNKLIDIMDHASQTQRRPLTQERMLEFDRDFSDFVFNDWHVSNMKRDLEKIAENYNLFKKAESYKDNYQQSRDMLNFIKSFHQHDDISGIVDEYSVNGNFSVYTEWLEFAKKHGYKSQHAPEEFLRDLKDSSDELNNAHYIIKNLSESLTLITGSKKNHKYVMALIEEFKSEYENTIKDQLSYMRTINQNSRKFVDTLELMKFDIYNMKNTLMSQFPDMFEPIAKRFCEFKENDDNSVSNFLKVKEFDDKIKTRIEFKGQNTSDIILFKDGSMAIKINEDYINMIDYKEFRNVKQDLLDSSIGYLSRKKPKIAEFFKAYIEDSSIDDIIDVLDTYQQYSDVITRANVDVLKLNGKSLEVVDDTFNKIILDHNVNNYTKSILSKKYAELLTPETSKVFKTLYENSVTKQDLQEYVGRKLAAIKTPEEFLAYMIKVKEHFTGFSDEALSAKLKGLDIKPTYAKDGIVIFHVKNFEESNKLGSVSWCISRNKSYFNDYTNNGSRQYFMYDFNKSEEDRESIIGFTIYKDGSIRASHWKNDDNFRFGSQYPELHLEVLKEDLKEFNLNEKYKKELQEKHQIEFEVEKHTVKKTGPKI